MTRGDTRTDDRGPTLLPLPILENGGSCGGEDGAGGGSPCDGCHGGCCRSFAVPVTGADVFRLTRATGRDFWEVACRWPDADGKIARRYAPPLYFADDPGGPSVLCLKHGARRRAARQHEVAGSCWKPPPTADRPRGTGRCGVYGDRPRGLPQLPDPVRGGRAARADPRRGRPGGGPAGTRPTTSAPARGRRRTWTR